MFPSSYVQLEDYPYDAYPAYQPEPSVAVLLQTAALCEEDGYPEDAEYWLQEAIVLEVYLMDKATKPYT